MKITDLDTIFFANSEVKPTTGDEVIFYEEINGDTQGRFVTTKITSIASEKVQTSSFWTMEKEESFSHILHAHPTEEAQSVNGLKDDCDIGHRYVKMQMV